MNIEKDKVVCYIAIDNRKVYVTDSSEITGPVEFIIFLDNKWLPFSIADLDVTGLFFRDTRVDLSCKLLPREIKYLRLFGCIVTGIPSRPIKVDRLDISSSTYISDAEEFNRALDVGVCLFTDKSHLMCVPYSTRIIKLPDDSIDFESVGFILDSHPNCEYIDIKFNMSTSMDEISKFFEKYHNQLSLRYFGEHRDSYLPPTEIERAVFTHLRTKYNITNFLRAPDFYHT